MAQVYMFNMIIYCTGGWIRISWRSEGVAWHWGGSRFLQTGASIATIICSISPSPLKRTDWKKKNRKTWAWGARIPSNPDWCKMQISPCTIAPLTFYGFASSKFPINYRKFTRNLGNARPQKVRGANEWTGRFNMVLQKWGRRQDIYTFFLRQLLIIGEWLEDSLLVYWICSVNKWD